MKIYSIPRSAIAAIAVLGLISAHPIYAASPTVWLGKVVWDFFEGKAKPTVRARNADRCLPPAAQATRDIGSARPAAMENHINNLTAEMNINFETLRNSTRQFRNTLGPDEVENFNEIMRLKDDLDRKQKQLEAVKAKLGIPKR